MKYASSNAESSIALYTIHAIRKRILMYIQNHNIVKKKLLKEKMRYHNIGNMSVSTCCRQCAIITPGEYLSTGAVKQV